MQTLIVDITDYAFLVEYKFQDILTPYVKGLYLTNKRAPLFKTGSKYYVMGKSDSDVARWIELDSIFNTKEMIYDDEQNPVMNGQMWNNIELHTTPTRPYRGFDIIEHTLRYTLWSLLKHKDDIAILPEDIFFDEFLSLEDVQMKNIDKYELKDCIISVFYELINLVREFVGKDFYKIHELKNSNGKIMILKGEDWRVLEYYRLIGSDQCKG